MFSWVIAKKITFKKGKSYSKLMVWIGVLGIALGVCVIQVSLSVFRGFNRAITESIFGYSAQLQIGKYNAQEGISNDSLRLTPKLIQQIKQQPQVLAMSSYAIIPAMAQSKTQIEGVVVKGISTDNKADFFKQHLKEGSVAIHDLDSTRLFPVLISQTLAKKLMVKVGDKLKLFFMQGQPRAKVMRIVGIYQTGLQLIDEATLISTLSPVQDLLHWEKEYVMGVEIFLKDTKTIEKQRENIKKVLFQEGQLQQEVYTVKELYHTLFDWLALQSGHVRIVILLMVVVAAINMISALLVLMLEQTRMIGIFKAMGAKTTQIQKIFIWQAFILIGLGALIGNIVSLFICGIQQQFHVFRLNSENYFLSYIPIDIQWADFIAVDIGVTVLCTLVMLLPVLYIGKVHPIKAIKMD